MLDWLELMWLHLLITAKPLRIQYCGAVYHVMARGGHGQGIFGDATDRKWFLEALGEACQKTGWRIDAYVLMGNHYHALVETPESNLVAGMKWLQAPTPSATTTATDFLAIFSKAAIKPS